MNELKMLGEKLLKYRYIFADHMELFQNGVYPFEEGQIREWRAGIVQIHAKALVGGKEEGMTRMKEYCLDVGRMLVEAGGSLDMAIENTSYSRGLFWSFIEEEVSNQQYPAEILLKAISIIDALLDVSIHSISVSFVNHFKETADIATNSLLQIKEQQSMIEELSTPIVQTVLQDVLLVPLIGKMDECRFLSLQNKVLVSCAETGAEAVIFDFSGMADLGDAYLVRLLDQLVQSLSLMGTEAIFVGFSPAAVMQFTGEFNMDNVGTFLNFRKAMAHLFRKRGLAILPDR